MLLLGVCASGPLGQRLYSKSSGGILSASYTPRASASLDSLLAIPCVIVCSCNLSVCGQGALLAFELLSWRINAKSPIVNLS